MLFGFTELVISGVLNMNTYTKARDFTFNETTAVFFAYFSLVFCLIVLPVFYMKQHLDGYEMEFGTDLPSEFSHFGIRRLWWGYFPYYLWYIFHRLLYLFCVFILQHPAAQFMSLFVINLCSMWFIAYYKPFIGRFANRYEMFCECSTCLVTVLFSSFRALWEDMDTRWAYGTLTIIIILLHGVVCLAVILYYLTTQGFLVLKWFYVYFTPYFAWLWWKFKLNCLKWE
jgi:hypothetical protein